MQSIATIERTREDEMMKKLTGEVGDYAIIARKDRDSADSFVGGVNDATAPRRRGDPAGGRQMNKYAASIPQLRTALRKGRFH
jgi:hypothetical protein